MADFGVSKRVAIIAIAILVLIYTFKLTYSSTSLLDTHSPFTKSPTPLNTNTYGEITTKVAVITDTQYTHNLIPLLLHFHSVLGPTWPIIFYTSPATLSQHLSPSSPGTSQIFQSAVSDSRIQLRTVPEEFNLTSREGVNIYLSSPWLWEQLAPAEKVLIFQADAILCANSHRTVDEFLQWDMIGAPLSSNEKVYNGGLSLRNRTLVLDIINAGTWDEEMKSGAWKGGGEDDWLSRRMEKRGAKLPDGGTAMQFACEFGWQIEREKMPLGYHKVHKWAPEKLEGIKGWCPEIALAAPGVLESSV